MLKKRIGIDLIVYILLLGSCGPSFAQQICTDEGALSAELLCRQVVNFDIDHDGNSLGDAVVIDAQYLS